MQMLEVGYLLYCGRYFYPVIILSLFLLSAVLLIHTLRAQRKKIKALVNECRLTPLVWDGWVRAISSHRLLPGDVMVLQQGKALCDMVVLQGTCLVVESMLSGEVSLCRLWPAGSWWGEADQGATYVHAFGCLLGLISVGQLQQLIVTCIQLPSCCMHTSQ